MSDLARDDANLEDAAKNLGQWAALAGRFWDAMRECGLPREARIAILSVWAQNLVEPEGDDDG